MWRRGTRACTWHQTGYWQQRWVRRLGTEHAKQGRGHVGRLGLTSLPLGMRGGSWLYQRFWMHVSSMYPDGLKGIMQAYMLPS